MESDRAGILVSSVHRCSRGREGISPRKKSRLFESEGTTSNAYRSCMIVFGRNHCIDLHLPGFVGPLIAVGQRRWISATHRIRSQARCTLCLTKK